MANSGNAKRDCKIRSLLKAGFTNLEIANELRCSAHAVQRQREWLRAIGGARGLSQRNSESEARIISMRRAASANRAVRWFDFNESNLDLCEIFNSPRTPKQIRYFNGGNQ